MSTTHDIACLTCRQYLWAGQRDYTYTAYRDEQGRRHLDRFLHEHMGEEHRLVFFSEHHEVRGQYDLVEVRYPEAEPEDRHGAEALKKLIQHAETQGPDMVKHRMRGAFELGRDVGQEACDVKRKRN